jgi:hypothetical protein
VAVRQSVIFSDNINQFKINFMNANELRIGNFVNVPREDQSPFRIDAFESLSNKFIKVAMIHPEYGENFHPLTWYGNDLKPIPLTEDWLLKFNLTEKESGGMVLSDNGWGILIFKQEDDSYDISARDEYHICKIKYVHQLQNLYFALTSAELTVA